MGSVSALTSVGSLYRLKMRAYNAAGYTDSAPLLATLSAVPDTPSSGPVSDASVTNESTIKVDYGPQAAADNGGSPIISYEL